MSQLKPHLVSLEAYLANVKEFGGTNAKFSHTMLDWLGILNSERGRTGASAIPRPAIHKIVAFEAERKAHLHAMQLGDGAAPASIDHWVHQQRETLGQIAHNEESHAQALAVPNSSGSAALAAPLKRGANGRSSRTKKHKASENTLIAHVTKSYERRRKDVDTMLPSGASLETIMFERAKEHTDAESLMHSWVLDLEDEWVEELAEADLEFLRNLWSTKRSSAALLDDSSMAWMATDPMLRKCYEYLAEAEEVYCAHQGNASAVRAALASSPLLKADESLPADERLLDVRLAMANMLRQFCSPQNEISNEASAFVLFWDHLFNGIAPKNFKITSMDTPVAASKWRKLKTYDNTKNVQGRRSDKGWVSSTGQAIAWGEAKKEDDVGSLKEAAHTTMKAIKGAKDCNDYNLNQTGRHTETFATTWLDWHVYALIGLESGISIVAEVFSLKMPPNVEGFFQLTDVMRHILAWNESMVRIANVLAGPKVRDNSDTRRRMLSAPTPQSSPAK